MARTNEVDPDTEKVQKTRVSFDVPAAVHRRFKSSCNLHGKAMYERLAEMMEADAAASGIPAHAN